MRNVGLEVKPPKKSCEDENCPYHGTLRVRGKVLEGLVATSKMSKTVTVKRDYFHYTPKYLRYEKRRSSILAHNPPCMEVREGDRVRIAECRPISKEVAFVVVEKISKD